MEGCSGVGALAALRAVPLSLPAQGVGCALDVVSRGKDKLTRHVAASIVCARAAAR